MISLSVLLLAKGLTVSDEIRRSFIVGQQSYQASITASDASVEIAILRKGSHPPAGFLAEIGGYQPRLTGPEVRDLTVHHTWHIDEAIVYAEWYFESWCESRIFLVKPRNVTCLFATSHRDARAWTYAQDGPGRLRSITFQDRWATQPKHLANGKRQMDRYVLTTTLRPDPKGQWKARTTGSWMPFKDLL